MRKSFTDRLSALAAVLTICDLNKPVVALIPGLADLLVIFRGKVNNITTRLENLERDTETITNNKNDKKEVALAQAVSIGLKLELLAADLGTPELMEGIYINTSKMSKGGEFVLLARMKKTLEKAKANQKAGEKYGIMPSVVTDFENAINAFSKDKGSPGLAISQRAAEIERVGELISEAANFLRNKILKTVKSEATRQPDFYASIVRSSKIKHTAGTRTTATDEVGPEPGTVNSQPKLAESPEDGSHAPANGTQPGLADA